MRILFMTQSNIGDVILSTVLLDRLLQAHPDATVDVVAGGRSVDLFEGMPNLGKLVPVVKKKRHMHYFDLWKAFVGTKYDIIVDLRGSALTYFLRGKKIIRFNSNDKETHKAEQLGKLFPSDAPLRQRVWPTKEVEARVAEEVKNVSGDVLVGLGPTANWIGKIWPQRHFALFVNELIKMPNFKDAKFVVFGAEHERKYVSDLIEHIPADRMVDLVGKTSLTEAYCWMSHLDGFLGNDSGLSHLAAAANIPTLTLFGPTKPELYAPVNPRGSIVVAPDRDVVNLEPSVHKRLITDIEPNLVIEKTVELIEKLKEEKGVKSA